MAIFDTTEVAGDGEALQRTYTGVKLETVDTSKGIPNVTRLSSPLQNMVRLSSTRCFRPLDSMKSRDNFHKPIFLLTIGIFCDKGTDKCHILYY
jgi:hypothetical protein